MSKDCRSTFMNLNELYLSDKIIFQGMVRNINSIYYNNKILNFYSKTSQNGKIYLNLFLKVCFMFNFFSNAAKTKSE